jgi:hypothetical protein
MTLSKRLTERRFNTLNGYSSGNIVDPAAIPPHGMGGNQSAGMLVNETSALTIDAVNTAIHFLTSGVIKRGTLKAYTASIGPAGLEQRKYAKTPNAFLENSFAFDGPLSNSQSRGFSQIVISLALFGESWLYQLTTNPRDGSTSSVMVLHPSLLRRAKKSGGMVWEYGVGQSKVELTETQLVHIVRSQLPNDERGLSNIREASVTYGIAMAAQQYTSLWFSQGAQPGVILTADAEISAEVANRLGQQFQVNHTGNSQAHIPVVTGNNVKVETLGSTGEESAMIPTLDYVRTSIGAMFGIPSHLLGGIADKGNVWGANHEEQMQSMEDFTYAAYVTPIEEAFSRLLPGNTKAAWPSTLIQPNMLNLGTALQFMRQAQVITPNEARSMYLGLGPLDGGDNLITPLASNTDTDMATGAANDDTDSSSGADSGDDSDSSDSPDSGD